MALQTYLPSRKFSGITGSILLALGLVWFASAITSPPKKSPSHLVVGGSSGASQVNWAATLHEIQSQQENRLPEPPNQAMVGSLLENAKTSSVTETVGRSLLINLTNARAQGLGGDQPTQDQLVAAALGELNAVATPSKRYTAEDLSVVPDSKDAVRAYGNAIVKAFLRHPRASMAETLTLMGKKVNGQSVGNLSFNVIATDYRGLAKDFSSITAPQAIAGYHLTVTNDYLQMADSFVHMQAVDADPLRGLAGLQVYNKSAEEAQSMFINIAQIFAKEGILFTKDEPGALLGSLLSGQ